MKSMVGAEVSYRLPFQVEIKRGIVVNQQVEVDNTWTLSIDNGDRLNDSPIRCLKILQPRLLNC